MNETTGPANAHVPEPSTASETVRALVVDDEPTWSQMISRALRRAGLEVTSVETAAQAEDLARANSYHLALIDYVLPGSGASGLEVAEVVRARNPDAVIIILTGWPNSALPKNAYRVKVDDLVLKSEISTDILLQRVSQALSRQRLDSKPLSVAYLETVANDSLSIIAHELRTPVVAIMRQAELMYSGAVGDLSDEQSEVVGLILSETRRALGLITGHLRLSHPRTPVTAVGVVGSELVRLLEEEFASYSITAHEKRLVIKVRSALEPQGIVRIDVDLLRLAINPLLENAVRFSPVDGRIDVSIEVYVGYVRVEITDSGPGMMPDDIDRLMNPLRASSALPSVRARGGGLGLFIAQRIAELHGGHLKVDETFTGGVRLILSLQEFQAIASS